MNHFHMMCTYSNIGLWFVICDSTHGDTKCAVMKIRDIKNEEHEP